MKNVGSLFKSGGLYMESPKNRLFAAKKIVLTNGSSYKKAEKRLTEKGKLVTISLY